MIRAVMITIVWHSRSNSTSSILHFCELVGLSASRSVSPVDRLVLLDRLGCPIGQPNRSASILTWLAYLLTLGYSRYLVWFGDSLTTSWTTKLKSLLSLLTRAGITQARPEAVWNLSLTFNPKSVYLSVEPESWTMCLFRLICKSVQVSFSPFWV